MPNGKLIAWIIGLSLLTTVALEHYRQNKPGAASRPTGGLLGKVA